MASVKITFIGHASFRFESDKGTVVYFDAWLDDNPTAKLKLSQVDKADIVIASHGHQDHIGGARALHDITGGTIVAHPVERFPIEEQLDGVKVGKIVGDGETLDTFEIVGTSHLGTQFTLAARMRSDELGLARLFSTHRGIGVPVSGELIFDVNPSVGTLSLTLNGQRVQSRPRFFRDGRYHHFAATHNRGEVKLYLDGNEVASERIRAGTMHLYYDDSIIDLRRAPDSSSEAGIHLAADLRVGKDQGGRFITYCDKVPAPPDNQLRGWVDDILVVRRVLSAEEIAALNNLPDR